MAKFLKSKVDAADVLITLSFQEGDPKGWEKLSAKDLGLTGGSGKTFFPNSVYDGTGLEVYRKKDDPDTFVLKFAALSFDGVPAVFGHYLGNPPKFNTKYADDYAAVYAAVGKLAEGGEIIATGFSLGGLAVNQLADRNNKEFSKADVTYIAFGGEYLSGSSADLINLGAYNDWFFGAYNAYAKLYKSGDPGLKSLSNFADTVFATEADLKGVSSASFLKKFFSVDRTSTHFANSVEWVFHFPWETKKSFILDNYFSSHDPGAMADAVKLSMKAPFAKELSLKTPTIFDFDNGKNAVLEITSHLQTFPGKLKSVYTIGSDGAGDVINGSKLNDYIAGMAGNDKLNGGVGADKLYGGTGADKLYGGAGADVFVFTSIKDSTSAASGRDTIYDFKQSEKDKIDLKALDANTKAVGDQAFTFIGTEKFHKQAGELRYEKKSGDTFIHGDVNGDGKVDFSVRVDASINFTKADFIL
mgnify:CR=1 FL=1